MDLQKLGFKFVDTIQYRKQLPTPNDFIKTYEQGYKPCVIKNYPLNWKAFTWTDEYVAEQIGHDYFPEYLNRQTPYLSDEEQGSDPRDTSIYLTDIQLMNTNLQKDYYVPELFVSAQYQPKEWQWLYWGPPSTGTHLHTDVDDSEAWNVTLKGKKLWWYFYDNDCYYAITEPGDIIYTPPNIPHRVVNLTTSMAITHNYKRVLPNVKVTKKWKTLW